MGYTHYYDVDGWDSEEWQAVWPKLIQDVHLIFEATDVHLTGPSDNDDDSVPPLANLDDGIYFNGVADNGYEPFCLSREEHHGFVKTAHRPYDTAVACVLLRSHILAPGNFAFSSDGSWDEDDWKEARELYQKIWPGEPVYCPWDEDEDDTESSSSGSGV